MDDERSGQHPQLKTQMPQVVNVGDPVQIRENEIAETSYHHNELQTYLFHP
jgi:hypothetical protein